jgi:putative transposase
MTIHSIEVMPDHVHLFVETDARKAPARIAFLFKGASPSILRKEFPSLRTRLPTLWSRPYFIASVGDASEAAIRRFIENQKGK